MTTYPSLLLSYSPFTKAVLSKAVLLCFLILNIAACSSLKEANREVAATTDNTQAEKQIEVTVVAVGDIMLGGKALHILRQEGYDYPFEHTKTLLQNADITIGNLETALTNSKTKVKDKKYTFKNSPEFVPPALKNAGFDIVSLANNHSMDYGETGLIDTRTALEQHDILHHGAGENDIQARTPAIIELEQGQRVGFLAYSNTFPEDFWSGPDNAGTAFGHKEDIVADVSALKEQGIETIIVSFHWGRELQTKLRDYQPLLAKAAIDAGADLIIGHHPHILQGVEYYRKGIILYSLGNFTFSSFSNKVHTSVIANIKFVNGDFSALELTPININNFQVQLQPSILTGEDAEQVYREMTTLSESLGVKLEMENNLMVFRPKTFD